MLCALDYRRRGKQEPFLAGVNDESPAAQEPDKCQSQFTGQFYRETRRRRYRCKERNTRCECLLHDFKSATATYQENATRKRQLAFEDRPTDDLVHSVVSADIFAQSKHLANSAEKRRRMQTTRAAEDGLRCAQLLAQLAEYVGIKA